jgi:hypothetical protein
MIRRNARITGKSALEQLQKAAVSELHSLRDAILEAVSASNGARASPEEAHDQILKAVRQAGMAVRDKAQAVRSWRESFEAEMQSSITQAAETHFTILENIRDLALQKIGMKWAWMDGVTYKDWAKYHLLKSRFDEWKGDLENHVVSHPSLEAAQLEAANIEDEAMNIASSTAKELVRLKQVGSWKLISGDDTPEFDSTLMQQAAEAVEAARAAAASAADAASEVKEAAEDAIVGSEKSEEEAIGEDDDAVLRPEDTAPLSETSEPSSSEPTGDNTGASLTETHLDQHSNEPEAEPDAPEQLSAPAEPASEASPEEDNTPPVASTMIFETPTMAGNFTESVEEDNAASGEPPVEAEDNAAPVGLPVEAEDDERLPAAAEDNDSEGLRVSDTASVKPALFGAAAQSVPNHQPILDEDVMDDVAAAMDSLRGDLEAAYSAAVSLANDQYSQALSIVSAQIQGTPLPAQKKLLASVTSAYSQAMASASSRLAAAGAFASAGSEEIAKQYSSASSMMSEMLASKGDPAMSESVMSRLVAAYATMQAGAASAASQAGEAASGVTAAPSRDEL